ncbi:histidine kinase [Sphingomonas populi]|uniref:histidine kinase n=2 Tax=Sphingomonas populi TaxID=2484750 RepID=A0A4Q6XYM1_9SPHN|nr:sensor histidine kinase [Sphingomonas populi]RZF65315.1 histidine kinase [Sphingomonas populi]
MIRRAIRVFGESEGAIGRLLIACMGIGFAALLAAGIGAVSTTMRNQAHTDMVNHTYTVKLAIAHTQTLIEQGETARRGYLLTGDPDYRHNYAVAAGQTGPEIARIARLTADNPAQRQNLAALRPYLRALLAQRAQTNAQVAQGARATALDSFVHEKGARRMYHIRRVLAAMSEEESRLLAMRDTEQRNTVSAFYGLLAGAGVLLVIVALLSITTVQRYTRDLAESRDTLRDFADSLEDLVAERTTELTRANEEVQRFAYIVSHDLRSPLVNVMGFTAELEAATVTISALIDRAEQDAPEILTEDVRLAAREDLPEAIGFIRTSTQKMDRLINAILKLSRQGRRVITPEPLDTAALAATIRASLQHLLDDRGAVLEIAEPMVPITSDRLALEQIFSNLIENAVKYLDPKRPGRIIVRSRREGARAIFEIEDNGRGIAPADHTRIFDLFRRSGQQDQPGEGIGLAHVRALAYRLGGTIDVASELGRGSTFRINLPVAYVEALTTRTERDPA